MKLFSQKEKAFYLFKDNVIENGVCCHVYKFIPGALHSGLFTSHEAVNYLSKSDSHIKFLDLEGTNYCFVRTRNKTYADKADYFASIVGSLVEPNEHRSHCFVPCFDYLIENEGEIFFIYDDGIMMVQVWVGDKHGSFKYTNAEKFFELVERFIDGIK